MNNGLFIKYLVATILCLAPLTANAHGSSREQKQKMMKKEVPSPLDTTSEKKGKLFDVSYKAATQLGRFHDWEFNVTRAGSQTALARDTKFKFVADMPQHLHGLASEPKVSNEGSGVFKVSGVRFHMPGWWTINVEVSEGSQKEDFEFQFMLTE